MKDQRHILDWLITCIVEAEADGYQQALDVNDASSVEDKKQWVDDPPEWAHNDKDEIGVLWNGKRFKIRITERKSK